MKITDIIESIQSHAQELYIDIAKDSDLEDWRLLWQQAYESGDNKLLEKAKDYFFEKVKGRDTSQLGDIKYVYCPSCERIYEDGDYYFMCRCSGMASEFIHLIRTPDRGLIKAPRKPKDKKTNQPIT